MQLLKIRTNLICGNTNTDSFSSDFKYLTSDLYRVEFDLADVFKYDQKATYSTSFSSAFNLLGVQHLDFRASGHKFRLGNTYWNFQVTTYYIIRQW